MGRSGFCFLGVFFLISSISFITIVIINQKAYSKWMLFLTPDETIDIFTFLEKYSNVVFDWN